VAGGAGGGAVGAGPILYIGSAIDGAGATGDAGAIGSAGPTDWAGAGGAATDGDTGGRAAGGVISTGIADEADEAADSPIRKYCRIKLGHSPTRQAPPSPRMALQ